jgi:formate dehydrogenase gamma subunit
LATLAQSVAVPGYTTDEGAGEILRFRKSERQLHWAVAVPFMVCLTTALILVTVYNPHPARPFRWVFSWMHRLSGVCLAVVPAWTFAKHRDDLRVYAHNVRTAWTWTRDDFRWLLLMVPATFDKRIALPHQGKFNAAEKINFMVLTVTYPMYVVTGILIWLPGVAYLSWILHILMAFNAVPLILGHVFMATVNPDTRVGLSGMVTGLVDRHWAKHHYRHWYDEHFGSTEAAGKTAAPVPKAVAETPALVEMVLAGRDLAAPHPAEPVLEVPGLVLAETASGEDDDTVAA